MERLILACGAALAGLGVAIGAFGAHALRGSLAPESLAVFETGVRYQMYGGLGMLAAAWAVARWPGRRLAPAAWLVAAGTVVFSGSLYVLVLTGVRAFGAVTPVGGVAVIAGWAWMVWRLLAREGGGSE